MTRPSKLSSFSSSAQRPAAERTASTTSENPLRAACTSGVHPSFPFLERMALDKSCAHTHARAHNTSKWKVQARACARADRTRLKLHSSPQILTRLGVESAMQRFACGLRKRTHVRFSLIHHPKHRLQVFAAERSQSDLPVQTAPHVGAPHPNTHRLTKAPPLEAIDTSREMERLPARRHPSGRMRTDASEGAGAWRVDISQSVRQNRRQRVTTCV